MKLDHLIYFSRTNGQEADELVKFGLKEGSNRIHPGQGTRNRKFYFNNFFLEIVWVHDIHKIKNDIVAPTQLWERANNKTNGISPFGICLKHTADVNELFNDCIKYQPEYISKNLCFEIITNSNSNYLPWTCRLPNQVLPYYAQEPINHFMDKKDLIRIVFGVPEKAYKNKFTDYFEHHSNISFHYNPSYNMTLIFKNDHNTRVHAFQNMPLIIQY